MSYKTSIAALAAAMLLAACASPSIHIRSTNSPPARAVPPGTAYSSAVIQADLSIGAYIGLLLFGRFLAGFEDDYRASREGRIARKPPELAEDRNIVELDCSRAIDRPTANLRCK